MAQEFASGMRTIKIFFWGGAGAVRPSGSLQTIFAFTHPPRTTCYFANPPPQGFFIAYQLILRFQLLLVKHFGTSVTKQNNNNHVIPFNVSLFKYV